MLPEEQRSVVLLVGLEGMRYEEVAAVLDVPVGTIRSRLSRGREALRRLTGSDPDRDTKNQVGNPTGCPAASRHRSSPVVSSEITVSPGCLPRRKRARQVGGTSRAAEAV
jgi:Sigma-70, region 4